MTSQTRSAALCSAFPLDSAINDRGRLEVGGCDVIELARELGTPAYVVAEEDLRVRARAALSAGREAGHDDLHVAFASKAFPCTAVLALFAAEGLWCDVASGGELHLALNAGFAPERILLHGNAKSERSSRMALGHGIGLIVLDSMQEIDRLAALLDGGAPVGAERSGVQPVLIRVTPDVRGDTHDKISTGQADSKFGFSMRDAHAVIERVRPMARLSLLGLHAHIGSQLLDLEPFRREVAQIAALGDFAVWDLGGGLGVRYTAEQAEPPTIEDYVATLVGAAHANGIGADRRLIIEPGRALVANACVTLYTVQTVKHNVSRWVAVDGGMSDNLRPMLYGAAYEAAGRRSLRRRGPLRAGGQALRVRRRDRARRDARRPAPGRCDRDAGHRRLRLCDGQQLQRRPAPAGHLLPRRRRARRRQARDLRRADRRDVR